MVITHAPRPDEDAPVPLLTPDPKLVLFDLDSVLMDTLTDPGDALYLGDMAVDQEAARRAGVRYVHAGWGYGDPTDPKPVVVGEPADLVRLLCTAPIAEAA